MLKFPQRIISFYKSILITITRFVDHKHRLLTGLPLRMRSEITPSLFVGGQYSGIGLEKLKLREFTAIVNMRTHTYEKLAKEKGMKYLHLSTPDRQAPSLEQLSTGVQFIYAEIEQGGRVYVHCRGGEGRGPSMVIAYLMSTGLTYKDAYAQVKQVRSFIRPTKVQIERLKEFEKSLG